VSLALDAYFERKLRAHKAGGKKQCHTRFQGTVQTVASALVLDVKADVHVARLVVNLVLDGGLALLEANADLFDLVVVARACRLRLQLCLQRPLRLGHQLLRKQRTQPLAQTQPLACM